MAMSPIMYQPLLVAHMRDTKIGKERLGDVIDRQLRFNVDKRIAGGPSVEAASEGARWIAESGVAGPAEKTLEGMVAIAGGASALRRVTLSDSHEGSIGNAFQNMLEDEPESLNPIMTLEQGRALAEQEIKRLDQFLTGRPLASYRSGTLDLDPRLSSFVRSTWDTAGPVDPDNAAVAAHNIGRAVQYSITPLEKGTLPWLDAGAAEVIAQLPGKIELWSDLLGFKRGADAKEQAASGAAIAKAAVGVRQTLATEQSPEADAGRVVAQLVRAAKIKLDEKDGPVAEATLQAMPSDHLAPTLAAAIQKAQRMPDDVYPWLTQRITELEGRPGNAEGLMSQLRERGADVS